ncbi:MAG: hypothetical protein ABGY75_07645 [Gemmataceae bacterium]
MTNLIELNVAESRHLRESPEGIRFLLSAGTLLHSQDAPTARLAKAAMTASIVWTAFGGRARTWQDLFELHQRFNAIHPEIVRLVRVGGERFVVLGVGSPQRLEFDFQDATGCTMVFPLTFEGAERFARTEDSIPDLYPFVEGAVRQRGAVPPRDFYLGAIVNLPSLSSNLVGTRADRVVLHLLGHLRYWFPWVQYTPDEESLTPHDGGRLPRLLCFSDNESVRELLERNQFRPCECPATRDGSSKYVLDFNRLRQPEVADAERGRLIQLLRCVSRVSDRFVQFDDPHE